ncbi:MAG: hypothetical protein AB8B85_08105 [Paracoccaceae bacterium]
MSEPVSKSSQDETFVLQADLSPADAEEAREALIAHLTTAKERAGSMTIEIDGGGGTPCALQLLVAAQRSAEVAQVGLNMSEQAGKLLAAVHAD